MDQAVAQAQQVSDDLKSRWDALRVKDPQLRTREAAEILGVSEAELVATRCGEDVRRLDARWGDLIKELPALGNVMALTRNDSVVHEKVGRFDNVSIYQNMGLVLNHDIDLRLFLNHWHIGFAITEAVKGGTRRSLQFFDADGTAVHKIYLRQDSNFEAYEALTAKFLSFDQAPKQHVLTKAELPTDRPDTAIDREALRARWQNLKDVHDFHAMLQDFGVGRVQAFRLIGEDLAHQVHNDSFRTSLEIAAEAELPIMIFAGSPGVIQIHTGPVHRLKEVGPWYNVLDSGFNLHLRLDDIASTWVIRKPTRDGVITSVEIFDSRNRQIAWMFGQRAEGQPERESWRRLVAELEIMETAC